MFASKLSRDELESFLDKYADKGVTVAAIAVHFEVSEDTVRRYLRLLRKEGVPMAYSNGGIHTVKDVNGKNATVIRNTAGWVSNGMGKLGLMAKNLKGPFRQALKYLPKDPEERKLLRLASVFIRNAIDFYDSQQELEEDTEE